MNKSLQKYLARWHAPRMEICTYMQPEWKFAQVCKHNEYLDKYTIVLIVWRPF